MPTVKNPEHREFLIWQHDQTINRRGVYIDERAARHALAACEELEDKLTRELHTASGGRIKTAGQTAEIAKFCELPDCTADTVEKALKGDLPPRQKRVLEIRRALGKASTKKLRKMLRSRNSDGRIRGLYQYHGAHTGRPAGRGVQPTNLPRPLVKGAWHVAEMFSRNDLDAIEMVYDDVTFAVADALRSMFTAAPGHELYAGDFKSIEAVVTAGLAGEQWKLDAFQKLLDGKGFVVDGVRYDDVYCASASKILQEPITKDMQEDRQVGKMGELAFGFGGGVGAWHNFDPDTKYTDEEIDEFKKGWRKAHPMIRRLWRGLGDAIIDAYYDGHAEYRDIEFERREQGGHDFVNMILPNEKRLHYLRPKIGEEEAPWSTEDNRVVLPKFYFAGYELMRGGTTRVWSEHCGTYGAKVAENAVQATAREIQMDRMLAVEYDLKMPVVMHTYDETVVEVPVGDDRYREFLDCLAEMPDYANWPIGVDGWRGVRNRK